MKKILSILAIGMFCVACIPGIAEAAAVTGGGGQPFGNQLAKTGTNYRGSSVISTSAVTVYSIKGAAHADVDEIVLYEIGTIAGILQTNLVRCAGAEKAGQDLVVDYGPYGRKFTALTIVVNGAIVHPFNSTVAYEVVTDA